MKQPHEDITGTQRDDALLSLDEGAIAHRTALIALAKHLRSATLVGNPAPVVADMWTRLDAPQPGDLVVETSTALNLRRPDSALTGLGYLIEHRIEWYMTDEEWEQIEREDPGAYDGERTTDHAWYIQYGPSPADVYRWVNCGFMVVPIDPAMFDRPIGQRLPGGGVRVDRASLLGSLADSGFTLGGAP